MSQTASDKMGVAPFSGELRAFLAERGFLSDDLSARDKRGATPLMHAARLAASALVEEMLRFGADIHAADEDGNQALWLACAGEVLDNVQLLIDAGPISSMSTPRARRRSCSQRRRDAPRPSLFCSPPAPIHSSKPSSD